MSNFQMPDPEVTVKEMNEYGYLWDGMLPLSKEVAEELFGEKNLPVYRLYGDDSEGLIDLKEEIEDFDGLFGIEKTDWERYLASQK